MNLPDTIPSGRYELAGDGTHKLVICYHGDHCAHGRALPPWVWSGESQAVSVSHPIGRFLLSMPQRPHDVRLDGPKTERVFWHDAAGRTLPDGDKVYRVGMEADDRRGFVVGAAPDHPTGETTHWADDGGCVRVVAP